MAKQVFNLAVWFNEKLNDEKFSVDFLSNRLDEFTDEIKVQLKSLKDDSHHLVPIINGLQGDSLSDNGHPAVVKMSFRHNSRDIEPEKIPEILNMGIESGQWIILVHGLMNDETIWKSGPKDLIVRMGTFFEDQKRANVIYLRYNTGRHISQNGRDLSSLIEELIEIHGNKIKDLVLTGHSMGGLVIRSACYYAGILKHSWVQKLKTVFLIGVPNEGSYLAKIAYMTQYFLRKIDPSQNQSIAKFFDLRSNGIKDLSFGFLVDEDWQNPAYENEKVISATRVYPIEGVNYHLIAATMTEKKNKSKLAVLFGDGLVEKKSALSQLFKDKQAKSGQVEFKLFEGENHLSLLESKLVHSYVAECLGWA
jgi:pimeloyl-ACP methyl ester carboxylesterase